MSYTNYWRRPSELPDEPFAAAVTDAKAVLKTVEVRLAGFEGTDQPMFEPCLRPASNVAWSSAQGLGWQPHVA
jgi:hypothetical protein